MSDGANGSLSTRQEKALAALLIEPTIQKAAASAGVNERSLRRWMREHTFAAAYRQARRENFSAAVGLMQKIVPQAVAAIYKVITDPGTPPAARAGAAASLIRLCRDSIEVDDLAARIEHLEVITASTDPRVFKNLAQESPERRRSVDATSP